MALAALRQALLDYALSPHVRPLEDRYNALTLSVLSEAFPAPLYAVTTQDPLSAVRVPRDPDYSGAPGSLTMITGPSPHRRSLSGSYYESAGGSPFGFPTEERQRTSLESVDSAGEPLTRGALRKPDFTVLSFDGTRVEPRVLVELKAPEGSRDEVVLEQVLQQVKAAVALTGVRPAVFLVRGTTWRHVGLPRTINNSTQASELRLSGAPFDSLDPGAAAALRRSCRHLPA